MAQGVRARAQLATPVAAPGGAVIDGVSWRCEGETCAGDGERRGGLDSLMKECRKVSAVLGPLAAYESRGRQMTPGNLKACNRTAASTAQLQALN